MQNYSSVQSLQPDRQQLRIQNMRHVQKETKLFKQHAKQHQEHAAATERT